MTKKLFSAITILALSIASVPQAFSQTPTPSTCPALYNGGIVCQEAKDFSVDKKVQTPKDGSYVDKITQGDAAITSGRTMIFRIVLTNKTARILSNITLTDTLPSFIQFVKSDPAMKQDGNKLTMILPTLEANKSKTVNIETIIKSEDSLPKGTDAVCVANQVEATSGFTNLARDFVTFCIDRSDSTATTNTTQPSFPYRQETKGGQPLPTPTPVQSGMTKGGQQIYPAPVTDKNPNTGPETLALIGLLPGGIAGFLIRKKTKLS